MFGIYSSVALYRSFDLDYSLFFFFVYAEPAGAAAFPYIPLSSFVRSHITSLLSCPSSHTLF